MRKRTATTNDESVPSVSRRRILQGTAAAGAFSLFPISGASADGPTEVVVRAEQVDIPFSSSDSTVDRLKATATESQKPIVGYVERTDGLEVKNQFWLSNSLLLDVEPEEFDPETLMAQKGVAEVHANSQFEIPDPDAASADAEETDVTYGLEQMGVPEAWDTYGTRGEGAKIAVLDTGVDPDHPDIDIAPENFSEFDSDGNEVDSDPYDSGYHGTHVSGTVAGGDDSGTAIGVAPEAELLHSLILPEGGGSFTQIIAGMQWAVEQDADVINMSLGASGYSAQMVEPVRNAEDAGTLVVAAAGNDGPGTSGSPGNVYDSFAAGASNEAEEIASFSGGETVTTEDAWGSTAPDEWPDSYVVPDAAAPGADVLSSYPVDHSDGPYNAISGTSMASPHIAGLAGLMESASGGGFSPDRMKKALTATAWKPDGEPDNPDTRYGHGIVDAVAAVGRLAADSGVTGTVTDADGAPIEGATVEIAGFSTETDADGEYEVRATSGTYDLTVDAFGHASQTVSVEVDDEFLTRDFTLADNLAVTPVTDQPDGLEAGESFDVEVEVANAETLTAALVGDYEGDAAISVDGEAAEFDEPVSLDGPVSDTVTVTVETGADGVGDLDLELTLAGLGETVSVTTGSTSVYADSVSVGIVDDSGAYGADVQSLLEAGTHPRYDFATLDAATALAAATDREHDAYVVQNLGTDDDLVAEFVEVGSAPEVGVVYLDQFGEASEGVSQISDATGDPSSTTDAYVEFEAPPVNYTVDRDHPVLDGIAEAGDSVTVNEPDSVSSGFYSYGGFHSHFEDYRGPISGTTLAGVALGAAESGDALAVDDLSRVVVASSLGVGEYVDRDAFTDDGRALLANLVSYAAQTPPVAVVETPAERIAPGESATAEIEVSNLLEVAFDVSGLRFIDESDLTLSVEGERVGLGEPITYDEPIDGAVEATIETPAGEVGQFALDMRVVSLDDRDREVETAATFRPTTAYESPIEVPNQLDDLQAAVDFVTSGDEVVVGGGTYEVADERGTQTGLYVGTSGVTIRGAEGATPEIVHADDLDSPNVVNVAADDVTIENLSVNVLGGEIDPKNEIGNAVRIGELVTGTTVRNATVAGTAGVLLGQDTSDLHVEDITVVDSDIGVGTDVNGGGPVANATITDVTFERPAESGWGGVYVENADGVTVTDSDITYGEGYQAGVLVWGDFDASDDNRIADNTIVGPDDDDPDTDTDNGIFVDEANVEIEGNDIADANVGIRVGDFGFGERDVSIEGNTVENAATGYLQTGDYVSLEGNVFEAETGLDVGGDFYGVDADAVVARHNDFSATDVPFVGDPSDGATAPTGPFDFRLNYLGERSYDDTIADGDAAYDPFLTAPPEEVEASEPTRIATDLYLDPDGSYGLGIPGPTDRTIYEILGVESFREFAGDLEYWHEESGKWKRVTGQGKLKYVETLSAFKVTPDEGVRAVVDFRTREDTPPGHHESNPGTTTLQKGWNVVAAPQYGDASEVFDADAIDEVADELDSPGGQLGEGDVAAFTGYKVRASESAELAAGLDAYAPTMTDLYESLGLDADIHDGVGPDADPTETDVTVADVLDAVSDDEATDAVASLVGHRIGQRLESVGDAETAADEIRSVATETVEAAPSGDRALVEDAAARVAALAFRTTVGAVSAEEDGDFATESARIAAENGGGATSALSVFGLSL
ncbi:S8 family serine peptidase [Halorussus amylolyticus]|uniref:S8 family serine peptidase n=1 Tax=Halorussus amylolyticus TaxID=1126242 RepID=UPI00104DA916|nr:S8 family serine peptidase [Halorussus amylolyticus]